MCPSVPNRGRGNQCGPGVVFCVFLSASVQDETEGPKRNLCFPWGPCGNPCLPGHAPKKTGRNVAEPFRGD